VYKSRMPEAAHEIRITVSRDEARAVRELLRVRRDIEVAERGRWFFWREFVITGPAPTIDALRKRIEAALWDVFMERAL
jgi:hypothetical protein